MTLTANEQDQIEAHNVLMCDKQSIPDSPYRELTKFHEGIENVRNLTLTKIDGDILPNTSSKFQDVRMPLFMHISAKYVFYFGQRAVVALCILHIVICYIATGTSCGI